MLTTGRLFVAAMWLIGVAGALAILARPALRDSAVMPGMWPLIAGLVAELVVNRLVAQGKAQPITMADRAIGIFGAIGIIILALARTEPTA